MFVLFDIADAEFEVADFGVGKFGLKFGEDFLFLESEFLDRHGVGDGDFEGAAAEAAWEGVFGEGGADGGGPGGAEIGASLNSAIAADGDELGEDVGNSFGFARW